MLSRQWDDLNLKIYYKQYCKVLSKVIIAAKKLHYNKIISKSNNKMRSTWEIINVEKGKTKRGNCVQSLMVENKVIRNQNKIANAFNKFFISIADSTILNKNVCSNQELPTPIDYLIDSFNLPVNKMKWQYASTQEITRIIKSLKTKNSTGYDEISNRIIKVSLPFIVSPLTYICNKILSTGVFPDRLKYATVKPLFKKGETQNMANYRPISLLTSFSKIIEKLMYARLINHIESNNILAQEQYGFRSHSSTEQAAFSLMNSILSAMNNKLMVGGLFCDLQKAFDCVNHKILLEKLIFYGIEGKFKSLIESYLMDRYQRVVIGNKFDSRSFSEWEVIKCGVPQGSILGPLFFLFYINDLPSISNKKNKTVLFADDTSIIITDVNKLELEINLKQTLKDIDTWFNANLLALNFKKSQYIEFRSKNCYNITPMTIDDEIKLPKVKETKFLGLIIDDTITWKQHINYVINKIARSCYALRNIKHFIPLDTLKVIYFAHIHSILSYGIIFWGNASYACNVFRLQKKAMRIIANFGPRESCRHLFEKFEILSFYSQFIYSLILFTINNDHLFNAITMIHEHKTRTHNNLYLPSVNLTKYSQSAYVAGIKAFNHLPQTLKELTLDVPNFKRALKRFLLHHSFYSMKEYYQQKWV